MPVIADLIIINAPASAMAGEIVVASITVKNIGSGSNYITVTGLEEYDTTQVPFQFDYLYLAPGQTGAFPVQFTMPNKSVRVWAWSWYWDGSKWVNDDTSYIDIALGTLAPAFQVFAVDEYIKV